MELEVRLLEEAKRPLKAPVKGDMARTIHESAACRAFYRFRKGESILYAFETERASFEYEYPSVSNEKPIDGCLFKKNANGSAPEARQEHWFS